MTEDRRGRIRENAIVALGEKRTKDGALVMQGDIVDEIEVSMVLDLVLRGRTMLQIADELDINYNRVLRVYKEALAAVAAQRMELGDLVMQDHLQKLQKVMLGLEDGVEHGNPKASEAYLRALEQEARLLSLYPDLKRGTGGPAINVQVNFNAFSDDEEEPAVVVGRRVMGDDFDD